MRSRTHALIISVLSVATVLFYWVGAAIVALTALRQGPKEALLLWFWVLLPAVVAAWMGEVAPIAVLSNVLIAALVLRATASWAYALLAIVAVSFALAGFTHLTQAQWLVVVEQQMQELFGQLGASMGASGEALIVPDKSQILSMMSLFSSLVATVCLLAGRAMQAALDKPNEFRNEFHLLRLPKGLALALSLLCLVVMMAVKPSLVSWAYLLGIPLFIHGLGLVHCFVAKTTNSRFTLIIVYVSVVFIGPAKVIIALLGFIDSWVDLRSKFSSPRKDL